MHRNYAPFLALAVCIATIALAQESGLQIRSSAFKDGSVIPSEYTCSGVDISPPLAWSGAPSATRSFALIVEDPDAPSGTFVHWVVYNVSPNTTGLPENALKSTSAIQSTAQGVNDMGEAYYGGPCPPPGLPHHYHFRLFALDSPVDLKPGASASAVRTAIAGHVLASAQLVGTFGR
jgi:Raf kinase inhibitor-like YbhB/YbcL family protein